MKLLSETILIIELGKFSRNILEHDVVIHAAIA